MTKPGGVTDPAFLYAERAGFMERAVNFLSVVVPTKGEQIVLSIGGALGAFASFALGGIDNAIIWLFIFTVVDYMTGIFAAARLGELSADKGRDGLLKKSFIFVIVALCHGADVVLDTKVLRDGAVIAYMVNEGLSVIENADRIGWGDYIPAPLRRALAAIKEKEQREVRP